MTSLPISENSKLSLNHTKTVKVQQNVGGVIQSNQTSKRFKIFLYPLEKLRHFAELYHLNNKAVIFCIVLLFVTGLGILRGAILWQSPLPSPLYSYPSKDLYSSFVVWSPDEQRVASLSSIGILRVWDNSSEKMSILSSTAGNYYLSNQAGIPIAWSPDGRRLAFINGDHTIQIWDAFENKIVTSLNYSNKLSALAWSPDSNRIASGSDNGIIQIWNAVTSKKLVTYMGHVDYLISHIDNLQGNSGGAFFIAWSPDGTRIASNSGYDNTIQVWNINTGKQIATFTNSDGSISALAWSPDGTRIVSYTNQYSYYDTIQVWNAITGQILVTYTDPSTISALAWSPDGTRIASGNYDGTIQVWNAVSGQKLLTYEGHTDFITAITWSPDGAKIASGSNDDTIQVWDATTGFEIYASYNNSPASNLAWSLDEERIFSLSVNGGVQVWKIM